MRCSYLPIMAMAAMLGGCSADAGQRQAQEGAERIECALGEGSDLAPDCLVERRAKGGERILVVRHPDGGFRRFQQVDDGRGLIVADGSDDAQRSLDGEMLDITVGNDRYRFPARTTAGGYGE